MACHDDLALAVLDGLSGLDARLLGGVEVALNLLLTLVHHADDLRPGELGKNDPDYKKGDKRRDELRHLRDEDVRTGSAVLGERGNRHEQRGRGRGECDRALLG